MSELTVQVPNSIKDRLTQFADTEGISVDQFVASALAEKIAVLDSLAYLEARADRADRTAFRRVLSAVPDTPAEPGDELPKP